MATEITGRQRIELALRVALVVVGVVAATSVILLGAFYPAASWFLLLLGVTLSAICARAARQPNLLRLSVAAAASALVPLVLIVL